MPEMIVSKGGTELTSGAVPRWAGSVAWQCWTLLAPPTIIGHRSADRFSRRKKVLPDSDGHYERGVSKEFLFRLSADRDERTLCAARNATRKIGRLRGTATAVACRFGSGAIRAERAIVPVQGSATRVVPR